MNAMNLRKLDSAPGGTGNSISRDSVESLNLVSLRTQKIYTLKNEICCLDCTLQINLELVNSHDVAADFVAICFHIAQSLDKLGRRVQLRAVVEPLLECFVCPVDASDDRMARNANSLLYHPQLENVQKYYFKLFRLDISSLYEPT